MTCPGGITVIQDICTPEWNCEIDVSGNRTGWMNDGCGNRRYSLESCPIKKGIGAGTMLGLTLLGVGILGAVIFGTREKKETTYIPPARR